MTAIKTALFITSFVSFVCHAQSGPMQVTPESTTLQATADDRTSACKDAKGQAQRWALGKTTLVNGFKKDGSYRIGECDCDSKTNVAGMKTYSCIVDASVGR